MGRADSPRSDLRGLTEPRLWTPPLRRLTRETTRGYEAIDFAEQVIGIELLPWQRWVLIHALELDPAGGYRFRTVVVLVARQNGKTTVMVLLALWRLFLDGARLVLGTAQDLSIAREAWLEVVHHTRNTPELAAETGKPRFVNGDEQLPLKSGARYLIKPTTRDATRGLSVDLLLMDELRKHRNWEAWSAASKTTMARIDGQTWALSNAGDDESVVLNHLRESALSGRDPSIGVFEWSGVDGCDLNDWDALRQANPGLGYVISPRAIESALATDPPDVFRTEVLCQRVDALDSAVDLAGWKACQDSQGTLDSLRDRVAVCLDVAPDGEHVTLAAAAEDDHGKVRVEIVEAWSSTEDARKALPDLIEDVNPREVAWFPSGPAGALGAEVRRFDPRDLTGGEVAEACQEFADLVTARRVLHPGDPLLDAHVSGARRLHQGDRWRFVRRGAGHVDAAYAAAGAAHCARTLPDEGVASWVEFA